MVLVSILLMMWKFKTRWKKKNKFYLQRQMHSRNSMFRLSECIRKERIYFSSWIYYELYSEFHQINFHEKITFTSGVDKRHSLCGMSQWETETGWYKSDFVCVCCVLVCLWIFFNSRFQDIYGSWKMSIVSGIPDSCLCTIHQKKQI